MTIIGTYRNGIIIPNEKLDLPEGTTVHIDAPAAVGVASAPKGSAWERHALGLGGLPGPEFDEPIAEMEDPIAR